MTLVTHAGRPVASRCCRDDGGEVAALRALPGDVDLRGCVPALDALHTTRDTARTIVGTHGADHVLPVKANCPGTFAQLAAVDWDGDDVRRHADEPAKAHGRIEARRVAARDPLPRTLAPFPEASQAFRASCANAPTRRPGRPRPGPPTASPPCRPAAPDPNGCRPGTAATGLLGNGNHFHARTRALRPASMGEDAARFRARHAPANHATLDNIVLAVVFHNGFRHLPEANRHCMMRRKDALDAILSPDQAYASTEPGRPPSAPPSASRGRAPPVRAEPTAANRRKAGVRRAGPP